MAQAPRAHTRSRVDALAEASALIATLGSRALIVTDAMMGKLGNLARVTDMLDGIGVAYHVYDEVNSEPVDTMVAAGVERYQQEGCDFMIALRRRLAHRHHEGHRNVRLERPRHRLVPGRGLLRPRLPHGRHPHHGGHGLRGHAVHHHHEHAGRP